MSRRFKIVTLGCKVNQYESAYMENSLADMGNRKAGKGEKADLVIVNTCIVTARASYQSRQAIRRAVRENPGAFVAAIGCYGQLFPGELEKIEGLNLVAGNKGKSHLPLVLTDAEPGDRPIVLGREFDFSEKFEAMPVVKFSNKTRAFLKIQDGCESFCTYCIVPFARGPLRSLEPDKVIELIGNLEANGYREAVLTGIHLGRYGAELDGEWGLNRLLTEIRKNGFKLRVRLGSLEPPEVDEEMIEMAEGGGWICPHFHISLQSGDDTVLRKMKRHYAAEGFSSLVKDLTLRIPDVCIGVDVLVGFPGEGDREFRNTYDLLKGLPVSYMHVFPYSDRQGTAAARFPGKVHPGIIKQRAGLLRDLGNKKRHQFYKSLLGKTFLVLTEGWAAGNNGLIKGLSENYARFVLPSCKPLKNRLMELKAERLTEKGIWGEGASD